MELEENPSMETNSKMKTSMSNTPDQDNSQWQMLESKKKLLVFKTQKKINVNEKKKKQLGTPTDLNSSSPPLFAIGLMENMLSLEKLLRVWMLSKLSNPREAKTEQPAPNASFLTVDNFKKNHQIKKKSFMR